MFFLLLLLLLWSPELEPASIRSCRASSNRLLSDFKPVAAANAAPPAACLEEGGEDFVGPANDEGTMAAEADEEEGASEKRRLRMELEDPPEQRITTINEQLLLISRRHLRWRG